MKPERMKSTVILFISLSQFIRGKQNMFECSNMKYNVISFYSLLLKVAIIKCSLNNTLFVVYEASCPEIHF